jgi:hypothetical protein
LTHFLRAFSKVPTEERRAKLARLPLITPFPHESSFLLQGFTEILEGAWKETRGDTPLPPVPSEDVLHSTHSSTTGHGVPMPCLCEECPYRKQIIAIENFYEDIFSLSDQPSIEV